MVELMSPCGSFETLNAAIKAGCDSIYFGIKQFNLRVGRAKNFELSDLPKIKGICTKNKVKCYITMNSIVYDNELGMIDNILDEVKTYKIDAVIAGDWAVILKARKRGISVHVTTQQSCSNFEALKLFSAYADRIVLARELSLEQIKNIKQNIIKENLKGASGKLLEIEAFCHGAMCISISGRCFLSQFIHNCSANRGQCLQTCRREYIVRDAEEGHELKLSNSYILSPKDLCTLEIIDKLIDAKIDVFKIEGRGRNADYVYTVTNAYRRAIDVVSKFNKSDKFNLNTNQNNAAKNIKYYGDKLKKELIESVKKVYNRGFSPGFYMGIPLNEWSNAYGSKATEQKRVLGRVTNYFSKQKVAEILIEGKEILNKGDDMVITGPTTGYYRTKVDKILNAATNKAINSAHQGDRITIKVAGKARKNDQIYMIKQIR
ncbi:U32 family peptidase [Candidatus Woesearchaeota archaeon]|nr:U32 family peptidase [Candidatus Woesearchaeota archaeon]